MKRGISFLIAGVFYCLITFFFADRLMIIAKAEETKIYKIMQVADDGYISLDEEIGQNEDSVLSDSISPISEDKNEDIILSGELGSQKKTFYKRTL